MKIKLLKDIPGYKAGDSISFLEWDFEKVNYLNRFKYDWPLLIGAGWAEEIKDDIDIHEIRERYKLSKMSDLLGSTISVEEGNWFTAYRIVKAVVEKLNGDWKPEWNKEEYWHISCGMDTSTFSVWQSWVKESILPEVKNTAIGRKVIELCEPELKVLFGVK